MTNLIIQLIFRIGDTGKKISILKLDVEGHEFKILPQIYESNMLGFVDQIIVELHFSDYYLNHNAEDMMGMLNSIKTLYSKGYKIISYDPNFTLGRMYSISKKYYTYFDITLANGKWNIGN